MQCKQGQLPTHLLTDVQTAVQEAHHSNGHGQGKANSWQAHGLQCCFVSCDGGHCARATQQARGVDSILQAELTPCNNTASTNKFINKSVTKCAATSVAMVCTAASRVSSNLQCPSTICSAPKRLERPARLLCLCKTLQTCRASVHLFHQNRPPLSCCRWPVSPPASYQQ
jgi:hypothetical protein